MAIVFKIDTKTRKKMIDYYKDMMRDKTPPYAVFQAEEAGTVVTLYDSGKVMFQGQREQEDAKMWQSFETTNEIDDKDEDFYNVSAVGSDEVGTGDFFGPVVVTAAFVEKEDIPFLEELGLKDSKKLDDNKIIKIAPIIAKKLFHKTLVMSPLEYNEFQDKGYNMNKIKAILHNKALYNLIINNDFEYDFIIVDQFATEKNYFKYLENEQKCIKNITFLTKGEDKNLAVAAASVISRFIFLKEMNKLSEDLHIPIKKGASKLVDENGKEIVEKYGKEKLREVAKLNFRNVEKILN